MNTNNLDTCPYKVILGSTSESRKVILKKAGVNISDYISADIDERSINGDSPQELVLKLSHAKLKAVLKKSDNILNSNNKGLMSKVLVICADSIAYKDGEIRNKPVDNEEKRQFLKSYSNSYVDVVSGIAIYNNVSNSIIDTVVTSRVYFKIIPQYVIENAVLYSKIIGNTCGGFAIDCPILEDYVDHIEGDHDNIMGISSIETKRLIELSIKQAK
ncbi:maf-like protein, putative [Cryptosporidium muris RN66]|uniref:Maf-like protein, putative n=1 Tax=Cryptosporidium muris (strain RN66) TaxID=441375 RepID=B6AJP3_CRYMR|nr:maf-like protein, putative [Cryptosporidium muris RN66]EEA08434.1 maf-like protein, putative [Cryptosporidium muris RN66]|eukprot:XP_002142783.1 maf-like protein [Cryptosporidium muris RN66]